MAFRKIKLPIPKHKLPRPWIAGPGQVVLPGNYFSRGTNQVNQVGKAYREALEKANAANEQRYQDILGGYDQLKGDVLGRMEGSQQQELSDVDRIYRERGADIYQRLVGRGFGNSSLLGTMGMGVDRERAASRNRVQSAYAGRMAGLEASLGTGKLGVMERRNDIAPDLNQMIALSQGMGAGGYGQQRYGGGGGGGGGVAAAMQGYVNPYAAAGIGTTVNNGQQMRNAYLRQMMMHLMQPRGPGARWGPLQRGSWVKRRRQGNYATPGRDGAPEL